MDIKCAECGKQINKRVYPKGLCQGCYKYFLNGGIVNPIPQKGTIARDQLGYVICHVCGRAYKRLGSHVRESHGMTIFEYKENFGLCNNSKTTEFSYSHHMSELAYKYEMPKILLQAGKETRIKAGDKDKRCGKKARLQECLDRSERYKIVKG